MSNRRSVTVLLPEAMIVELDRARAREERSRSEIVRDALRWYFRRVPVENPTSSELEAIEEGRAAVERGDYVTFGQLLHDLDADCRQPGAKTT